MKILSFSLDNQLLKKDSAVAKRLAKLETVVDKIDFIVPSQKKTVVSLAENVTVLSSGGQAKINRLLKIYLLGRALIKDRAYDLLTVQDASFVALVVMVLGQTYNLPVEIQVHGFEKNSWLKKIISGFVLKRATGIRVVSGRLQTQLVNDYRVAASKISIIPIVSPALNREAVSVRPFSHPPRLLSIGRLVPVKGFNYLIEAVNLLSEAGNDFHLTIIGEGGEYHHLTKLIKRYGLEQKVIVKKPTDDVAEEYRQADIFIVSSLAEGYSLVATEAASFGLPIVMTDVGLAGELLIDNQSAKVVSPKDGRKLAEAIGLLLEDRELAAKLGEAAFKAAQTLPSPEETLFLYKKAWAKLL